MLSNARDVYQRDRQVVKTGGVSEQQLQSDKTAVQQADAQVQQAQVNLKYATIRAPFTGALGLRQVSLGAYLKAGDAIVSIRQLDPLFLDFELPQQTIGRIMPGQTANFSVPGLDGEFEGAVTAIGISIGGPASPRLGLAFPRLKPFDQRNMSQMEIVRRLFPRLMQIPGVLAFPINPPSLGEQATSQEFQFVVLGPSLKELAKLNRKMIDQARRTKGMINVQSDLTTETPQLNVDFHRERASDLGISVADVARALEVGLGGSHVTDFIMNNKSYRVLVQLEPKFRAQPGQISDIYARDRAGKPVPLSYLVSLTNTYGPDTIFHYNLQRSFTISASLQASLPLSKALDDMQANAGKILPAGYSTALTGQSRDYRETSASLYVTFAVSLVFIYLVLAAQFESWVHPLTIMFSVPLALTGALMALVATGNTINLYSEIGIILLIGLVTKNGILMVDYANHLRAGTKS